MELKSTANVKVGGLGESRQYSFQLSGEMFDAVFKTLYSNPIRSIIRELTTNAIEVSPPGKPPIIHVPSSLAPTFSIRDFGPGLSRQAMFDIYAVAGASTKRDSNEYIGAFGLGAKSPFAYTDSYSVDSYHDGHKSSYLIYRDPAGIPTMSLISTNPYRTTETGLHITIGVKPSDVLGWIAVLQADDLLSHMPIIPNLTNTTKQVPPPPTLLNKIDNVAIWPKSPGSTNYLRMGGPLYPIRRILNIPGAAGLYIDAPIGSVDLTPSREELRYTPKTTTYITSAIDSYFTAISTEITTAYAQCRDPFEAARFHHSLTHSVDNTRFPIYNSLPSSIKCRVFPSTWNHPTNGLSWRYTGGSYRETLGNLLPDSTLISGLVYEDLHIWRNKIVTSVPRSLKDLLIELLPSKSKRTILVIHPEDKFFRAKVKQHSIEYGDITLKSDAPRSVWDTILLYLKDYEIIHLNDYQYTRPTVSRNSTIIPKFTFPAIHIYTWNDRIHGGKNLFQADQGGFYLYSYKNVPYWADTKLTHENIDTQINIPIRRYKALADFTKQGTLLEKVIHITPSQYSEFARVQKVSPGTWQHFRSLAITILDAAYLQYLSTAPRDTSVVDDVLSFGPALRYPIPPRYTSLIDKIIAANKAYYSKHSKPVLGLNSFSLAEFQTLAKEISHTLPTLPTSNNVDPLIQALLDCKADPLFPALCTIKEILDSINPYGYHNSKLHNLYSHI